MRDPYQVLGVARADTEDTIRKAYRKLAKKYHPDLNAGKADTAERFKEINAAHDFLSDPIRRGRFDRGEIDAEGRDAIPRGYPRGAGGSGRRTPPGGLDPEELERMFGGLGGQGLNGGFGNGGFGGFGGGSPNRNGADAAYTLEVDFLDAARGVVRRLALPDGRSLDVTVPAGVPEGNVLRLRGQGRPGLLGGQPGDALVEIKVRPHAFFRREGDDVVLRLPISLQEAVLGASVDVPTIRGRVRLAIPPNSVNGARMRLRGRGINDGHQFVELSVTLPQHPDPALAAFLGSWTPEQPFDPRADLQDI